MGQVLNVRYCSGGERRGTFLLVHKPLLEDECSALVLAIRWVGRCEELAYRGEGCVCGAPQGICYEWWARAATFAASPAHPVRRLT